VFLIPDDAVFAVILVMRAVSGYGVRCVCTGRAGMSEKGIRVLEIVKHCLATGEAEASAALGHFP